MKAVLLIVLTACLGFAAAEATHKLTLFYPSYVGESQLKPGDCTLVIDGDRVMIKQGRKKLEVQARVEANEEKFKNTSVRYRDDNGKRQITEISIGGTTTKLVFQ